MRRPEPSEISGVQGENDVSFVMHRADTKQQTLHNPRDKHGRLLSGDSEPITTVLTPVRRSRRSQVQAKVPLTDQLKEASWAYSPNPALANRTLSRAEEDLLEESLAQLKVHDV